MSKSDVNSERSQCRYIGLSYGSFTHREAGIPACRTEMVKITIMVMMMVFMIMVVIVVIIMIIIVNVILTVIIIVIIIIIQIYYN